jgi:deoxyribodipyrimidine photo-lyase
MTVIHWFRRDLRLSDNTALHAALRSGEPVVPLFMIDPALLRGERFGLPRMKLLLNTLRTLDDSLRQHGSRLLIRHGSPLEGLPAIIADVNASALYFNRDYTPYARKRDAELERILTMPVHSFDDLLLHAPGDVRKGDGGVYTVYTPFRRQWESLPKTSPANQLPYGTFHPLDTVDTPPIPTLRDLGLSDTIDVPPAGELYAQRRLSAFVKAAIFDYAVGRDTLTANPFEQDSAATSGLSAYLRLGMLSIRQAYATADEARHRTSSKDGLDSVNTWLSELAWRDFYTHILAHFPHVHQRNFRPEYDNVQFREAPDELQRWKDGTTGYPVVDAAMRQLKGIGWMHNRARMIVASFLTKDLLIHWWHGDVHFQQWLIDGDPAANNGGWQWAAGTGTDAQPYFRIFNPVSQSKKFDPSGVYIRHWLPELRGVPDKFIHEPWTMPQPPRDYPPPMVDHKMARERTLQAFKAAKTEEK